MNLMRYVSVLTLTSTCALFGAAYESSGDSSWINYFHSLMRSGQSNTGNRGRENRHTAPQERDYINFYRQLVQSKRPYEETKIGTTALIEAVQRGDFDKIKSLLVQKIDNIDFQNEDGDTALTIALTMGYYDIAIKLIFAGINLNLQNEDGDSALIIATRMNHATVINALIKAGAEINVKNNQSETPLLFAIEHNNEAIINTLIEMGANVRQNFDIAKERNLERAENLLVNHLPLYSIERYGKHIFGAATASSFFITATAINWWRTCKR